MKKPTKAKPRMGRPPLPAAERGQPIQCWLPSKLIKALDRWRGDTPRSAAIRHAIQKAVESE